MGWLLEMESSMRTLSQRWCHKQVSSLVFPCSAIWGQCSFLLPKAPSWKWRAGPTRYCQQLDLGPSLLPKLYGVNFCSDTGAQCQTFFKKQREEINVRLQGSMRPWDVKNMEINRLSLSTSGSGMMAPLKREGAQDAANPPGCWKPTLQLMLRFSSAAPQETYSWQPSFSKQKLRRIKETGQGC